MLQLRHGQGRLILRNGTVKYEQGCVRMQDIIAVDSKVRTTRALPMGMGCASAVTIDTALEEANVQGRDECEELER